MILLIDKEEYDTNSEVIVYVPTSHVLVHEADMLSVQLLTYFRQAGTYIEIIITVGLVRTQMTWFLSLMSPAGITRPPAPSSTPRTSPSTSTLARISKGRGQNYFFF